MRKIILFIVLILCVSLVHGQQERSAVFLTTTTPPTFPGGEEAMMQYIKSRLVYPSEAVDSDIQGKVLVGFSIDSFGYVKNIRLLEGIHPACDSVALNIISDMPRWSPSKSEPDIEFTLPFIFTLPDERIRTVCDTMPQFPGGMDSMFQFINRNLKYPVMDDCSIQGRVVIRFVVTKKGEVKDPVVIRSVQRFFDNEALRVIDLMPDWEPAIHRGKKVDCYFTLPVAFRLWY